jgi:hypothetical protein
VNIAKKNVGMALMEWRVCQESAGMSLRESGRRQKIKKGQDKNPAPFLNPISYEKPEI